MSEYTRAIEVAVMVRKMNTGRKFKGRIGWRVVNRRVIVPEPWIFYGELVDLQGEEE